MQAQFDQAPFDMVCPALRATALGATCVGYVIGALQGTHTCGKEHVQHSARHGILPQSPPDTGLASQAACQQ